MANREMKTMKKSILVLVLLLMAGFASAVDTIEDLEQTEVSILPIHPLYFAKEWYNGFRLQFAFSDADKAKVELSIAREKLVEAVHLRAMNRNEWAVRQMNAYEESMDRANRFSDKATGVAKREAEVETGILNGIALQVLERVRERAPEQSQPELEMVQERLRARTKEFVLVDIDLRNFAAERYSEFLGQAESSCVSAGGQWIFESNTVGCKNISGYSGFCDNFLLAGVIDSCEGIGGNVVCSNKDFYCEVN